jgi:hypothetical protein
VKCWLVTVDTRDEKQAPFCFAWFHRLTKGMYVLTIIIFFFLLSGHGVSVALQPVSCRGYIGLHHEHYRCGFTNKYCMTHLFPFFTLGQWLEVRSQNYSIAGRTSRRTGDVWVLSYSCSHWKWYVHVHTVRYGWIVIL